jgi:hypothetical protein
VADVVVKWLLEPSVVKQAIEEKRDLRIRIFVHRPSTGRHVSYWSTHTELI